MNLGAVALIILVISIILAIKSVKEELAVPKSVAGLKIRKKKGISGVILFLKKKVVHYSSDPS